MLNSYHEKSIIRRKELLKWFEVRRYYLTSFSVMDVYKNSYLYTNKSHSIAEHDIRALCKQDKLVITGIRPKRYRFKETE
jgi:hypothetical protein